MGPGELFGVEIGDREGNVGWRGVLGCLIGILFGC